LTFYYGHEYHILADGTLVKVGLLVWVLLSSVYLSVRLSRMYCG